MKRTATCLAITALVIAGALAGAASANIDPQGYQRITPYRCPEFGGPGIQFGTDQEGLGVRLAYGWAAQQTVQLDQFLAVQSGTVTLTGPNNYSHTDSWAKGDTTGWSPYTVTQGTPPGQSQPTDVYLTQKFTNFGNGLAAGNYLLSVDLRIKTGVNDGYGAAKPGSWVKVTNCPVTITQGP